MCLVRPRDFFIIKTVYLTKCFVIHGALLIDLLLSFSISRCMKNFNFILTTEVNINLFFSLIPIFEVGIRVGNFESDSMFAYCYLKLFKILC